MPAGGSAAVAPQLLNEVPMQPGQRAAVGRWRGVGEEIAAGLEAPHGGHARGSHRAFTWLGFPDQFPQKRRVRPRAGVAVHDPHVSQRLGTERVGIRPAEVVGRVGAQRRRVQVVRLLGLMGLEVGEEVGRADRAAAGTRGPGPGRRDLPDARKQASASSKRPCALRMMPRLSLASGSCRLDGEGTAVARHGLVDAAQVAQRIAQELVRGGRFRRQPPRPPRNSMASPGRRTGRAGCRGSAGRARGARFPLEGCPVDGLRRLEPALGMQRHCPG